jgi:hypothetical protein
MLYAMLNRSWCELPLSDVNWGNFTPIKVHVFFWVLRHVNTRTRAFLCRHNTLGIENYFPFCTSVAENELNLFFACPRLLRFWASICPGAIVSDVPSLVQVVPLPPGFPRYTAALLLLWVVWKSRNRMIFDFVAQPIASIIITVREHAALWAHRASRHTNTTPFEEWCVALAIT